MAIIQQQTLLLVDKLGQARRGVYDIPCFDYRKYKYTPSQKSSGKRLSSS